MNLFDPFLCRIYLALAVFAVFAVASHRAQREQQRRDEERQRRISQPIANPYR